MKKIRYKESLTIIIIYMIESIILTLVILASPVFFTEEISLWFFPYAIYFWCLFIAACAPFLSIFEKNPKDTLLILRISMIMMVILAIPAPFSYYREVHFVFLGIGGIGAAISFGVSMLRIKLQKKHHKA